MTTDWRPSAVDQRPRPERDVATRAGCSVVTPESVQPPQTIGRTGRVETRRCGPSACGKRPSGRLHCDERASPSAGRSGRIRAIASSSLRSCDDRAAGGRMRSCGRWPLDADDWATFAEHRAVEKNSPTVALAVSRLPSVSSPASGGATSLTSSCSVCWTALAAPFRAGDPETVGSRHFQRSGVATRRRRFRERTCGSLATAGARERRRRCRWIFRDSFSRVATVPPARLSLTGGFVGEALVRRRSSDTSKAVVRWRGSRGRVRRTPAVGGQIRRWLELRPNREVSSTGAETTA